MGWAAAMAPPNAPGHPPRLASSATSAAGGLLTAGYWRRGVQRPASAYARRLPRRRGSALRRRDQRLEQPWIVTRLRVPLDREHERMVLPASQLDRFDDPVRRPGGGGQACPQLVDRLMVGGGHRKRPVRLHDAGQHAARGAPHLRAAEAPRLRPRGKTPGRLLSRGP